MPKKQKPFITLGQAVSAEVIQNMSRTADTRAEHHKMPTPPTTLSEDHIAGIRAVLAGVDWERDLTDAEIRYAYADLTTDVRRKIEPDFMSRILMTQTAIMEYFDKPPHQRGH